MTNSESRGNELPESKPLRERAEQMLQTSRDEIAGMSPDAIQSMFHELQVHQIELKLQNEELREAQLELARSRDLYSDLYEFAPVGYLTLDRKGSILQANLTIAEMLGVERRGLTGRKLAEFTIQGSSDELHRHLQSVFSTDTKITSELTMIGANNGGRVFQLESRAVSDDRGDGDPLNSFQCRTAIIDVTQQREATEWIVQAKRLRSMVENLPAGAVFVDNERIEINPAVEAITGYFRSELTTLDMWYEKLYGARQNEIRQQHDVDRANGFSESALTTLTRKDGAERLVEFSAHGFDNHEVWLMNDVTERKRAEEALRLEHELNESLINTAQGIVLLLDMQGKILRFNPYFESLTGWRLEDVKGLDWLGTCIPENERAAIRQRIDSTLSGTRTVGQVNGVLCRDGSVRIIEWYDAILSDENGEKIGLLATGQDITERRTLERHLLQIADDEKRRIGHDLHDGLGQELTGLSMMAESLRLDLQDKSLPESKIAERIAQQIVVSLDKLRILAKGMSPVNIDSQGLVSELTQLASHISRLYGIECTFTCDSRVVLDDSEIVTNLYRIAQEAITNSVKHGKADQIEISILQADDRIVLQVSDNGGGFAKQEEIHTGVGMRSMRYRADVIGGSLRIEQRKQGGTAVICTLPIN